MALYAALLLSGPVHYIVLRLSLFDYDYHLSCFCLLFALLELGHPLINPPLEVVLTLSLEQYFSTICDKAQPCPHSCRSAALSM